jgi:peptidoglycan/xylan/chitin deacetylase (PgdA/CDA1 family)
MDEKMSKNHLVIGVTYHGSVQKTLSGLDNVHGKHISADRLKRHLEWYKKRFQVVGLGELMRTVRSGKNPPDRSLFVVFHDGYRHNYEVAFPILKDYGIKATFFLTTSFIGTEKRFWGDVLDAAVKHSEKDGITIGDDLKKLDLSSDEKRYTAALELRRLLKPLPEDLFRERFAEALSNLGFDSENDVPRLGNHEHCLDWNMVREMARAGMEFGSHTHRHIICARQSAETAREEMAISKSTIKREIGVECELFCYPNGSYPRDGNDDTDRLAGQVGYRHVLYMVGPYNLINADTFRLTGIAFGEDSDRRELERSLSARRFWARKLRRSPIWPWEKDHPD